MDEQAIKDFLAVSYARVVATVALATNSRAGAEDAVQEALIRAWQQRVPLESPVAWITTVALNLSRSTARRVLAERRARSKMPPAVSPDLSGDVVDVQRALEELTRRQREVTVLRYYAGMDVAEIAATLSVTEGTVKTLLHRAREVLARRLGDVEAGVSRART